MGTARSRPQRRRNQANEARAAAFVRDFACRLLSRSKSVCFLEACVESARLLDAQKIDQPAYPSTNKTATTTTASATALVTLVRGAQFEATSVREALLLVGNDETTHTLANVVREIVDLGVNPHFPTVLSTGQCTKAQLAKLLHQEPQQQPRQDPAPKAHASPRMRTVLVRETRTTPLLDWWRARMTSNQQQEHDVRLWAVVLFQVASAFYALCQAGLRQFSLLPSACSVDLTLTTPSLGLQGGVYLYDGRLLSAFNAPLKIIVARFEHVVRSDRMPWQPTWRNFLRAFATECVSTLPATEQDAFARACVSFPANAAFDDLTREEKAQRELGLAELPLLMQRLAELPNQPWLSATRFAWSEAQPFYWVCWDGVATTACPSLRGVHQTWRQRLGSKMELWRRFKVAANALFPTVRTVRPTTALRGVGLFVRPSTAELQRWLKRTYGPAAAAELVEEMGSSTKADESVTAPQEPAVWGEAFGALEGSVASNPNIPTLNVVRRATQDFERERHCESVRETERVATQLPTQEPPPPPPGSDRWLGLARQVRKEVVGTEKRDIALEDKEAGAEDESEAGEDGLAPEALEDQRGRAIVQYDDYVRINDAPRVVAASGVSRKHV